MAKLSLTARKDIKDSETKLQENLKTIEVRSKQNVFLNARLPPVLTFSFRPQLVLHSRLSLTFLHSPLLLKRGDTRTGLEPSFTAGTIGELPFLI